MVVKGDKVLYVQDLVEYLKFCNSQMITLFCQEVKYDVISANLCQLLWRP